MKSKLKRLAVLTMVLLLLITPLSGCSKWRYNAEIYAHTGFDLVDPVFYYSHMISGVSYYNPEYDDTALNPPEQYLRDDTMPETRTYIITDKTLFETIYLEDQCDVDFEKQMVLLHIYAKKGSDNLEIDKINVEQATLNVYIKKVKNKKGVLTGIPPHARCITIIMDKLDVDTVNFIIK